MPLTRLIYYSLQLFSDLFSPFSPSLFPSSRCLLYFHFFFNFYFHLCSFGKHFQFVPLMVLYLPNQCLVYYAIVSLEITVHGPHCPRLGPLSPSLNVIPYGYISCRCTYFSSCYLSFTQDTILSISNLSSCFLSPFLFINGCFVIL